MRFRSSSGGFDRRASSLTVVVPTVIEITGRRSPILVAVLKRVNTNDVQLLARSNRLAERISSDP
jgi:hypothetical protein